MHEYRVLFHTPGAREHRGVNFYANSFRHAVVEADLRRDSKEFIKSIEHLGRKEGA